MLDPFSNQFSLGGLNTPGAISRTSGKVVDTSISLVNAMSNQGTVRFWYITIDKLCFFSLYLDSGGGGTTGSGALQINLPITPVVFTSNVREVATGIMRPSSTTWRPAFGLIANNETILRVYYLAPATVDATTVLSSTRTEMQVDIFSTTAGMLYLRGNYVIA